MHICHQWFGANYFKKCYFSDSNHLFSNLKKKKQTLYNRIITNTHNLLSFKSMHMFLWANLPPRMAVYSVLLKNSIFRLLIPSPVSNTWSGWYLGQMPPLNQMWWEVLVKWRGKDQCLPFILALRVPQGSPPTTEQPLFTIQLGVLLPSKGEVKFTSVDLKKQEKHHHTTYVKRKPVFLLVNIIAQWVAGCWGWWACGGLYLF